MRYLLGLLLALLPVSAQTYTCSGCTNYGLIGTTGLTLQGGSRMVWTVGGLENTTYRVDLTFVETVYTTVNQRPLNVMVNDVPMLTGFDIIAATGFMNPVTRSVLVPVNDGKILIVMTASTTGGVAHKAVVSVVAVSKLVTSGGGNPGPVTQSNFCRLTRTSPTLLTMSECPILVSGVFFNIAPGTIGVTAGTGNVIASVDLTTSTPMGRVTASRELTATCAGLGGCTAAQTGEAFIPGDLPIGVWSVTNGQFDVNGYTPLLATIQGFRLESIGGLVQVQSGHKVQIRVNSDIYPPVQ